MGSSDFLEAGFTGADYGSAFRRMLPDIAMMLRVDTLPIGAGEPAAPA
jgi:hypothetical protein